MGTVDSTIVNQFSHLSDEEFRELLRVLHKEESKRAMSELIKRRRRTWM